MIEIVTVRAVRDFSYHGDRIHTGALVRMAPVDAAIAARAGWISLTRDSAAMAARSGTPRPPSPASPRRRRTYKRRDLVPEP